MKSKTLKTIAIPLLLLLWTVVAFVFNSSKPFIEYECCNEYKYLNNYAVMLINSWPFIISSVILILTIMFIKINNTILIIELEVVILISSLIFILMVVVFLADQDMINQVNNVFYFMIQDFIYVIFCILISLSAIIKVVKTSDLIVKESKI